MAQAAAQAAQAVRTLFPRTAAQAAQAAQAARTARTLAPTSTAHPHPVKQVGQATQSRNLSTTPQQKSEESNFKAAKLGNGVEIFPTKKQLLEALASHFGPDKAPEALSEIEGIVSGLPTPPQENEIASVEITLGRCPRTGEPTISANQSYDRIDTATS